MKYSALSMIIAAAATVASLGAAEQSPLTFQVGGGFTQGVGRTGTYLDTGWNITGGFGFDFNSHFGAMINVTDNGLGINSSTLGTIGVPGGDVNLLTATLDPLVHLTPKGHFDLYVTGGGGLFHRRQEFTTPPSRQVLALSLFSDSIRQ